MSEETVSIPADCYLSGGPQDGARCTFDLLPIMLVDPHDGGYYSQTTERIRDGAFVFEYHAPARAPRHRLRVS